MANELETLYNSVPPTKLRNRKEKFRPATNTPFWESVADFFFFKMIEHRFHAMIIKNEHHFEERNKDYASIFFAPHSNWWDGIVGYNMMRRVFKTTVREMVEEMNRFLCVFPNHQPHILRKSSHLAEIIYLPEKHLPLREEENDSFLLPFL